MRLNFLPLGVMIFAWKSQIFTLILWDREENCFCRCACVDWFYPCIFLWAFCVWDSFSQLVLCSAGNENWRCHFVQFQFLCVGAAKHFSWWNVFLLQKMVFSYVLLCRINRKCFPVRKREPHKMLTRNNGKSFSLGSHRNSFIQKWWLSVLISNKHLHNSMLTSAIKVQVDLLLCWYFLFSSSARPFGLYRCILCLQEWEVLKIVYMMILSRLIYYYCFFFKIIGSKFYASAFSESWYLIGKSSFGPPTAKWPHWFFIDWRILFVRFLYLSS